MAQLERRGTPTVVLVGHSFTALARAHAETVEYPDARLVEFEHPIAGTGYESVRTKGAALVDDVIAALLH